MTGQLNNLLLNLHTDKGLKEVIGDVTGGGQHEIFAAQPGRVKLPFEINLNVIQVPDEISETGTAVFEYFPIRGEEVSGPS